MTVYYVKNGGTATVGGYASRQTTDFATLGAANYYPSLSSVVVGNVLVNGDEIAFSNIHAVLYAANTTISIIAKVSFYSVLDTDLTTYTAGATEEADSGFDINVYSTSTGSINSSGVNFIADDDVKLSAVRNTSILNDSVIKITGTGSAETIIVQGDAGHLTLKNSSIIFVDYRHKFFTYATIKLLIESCTIDYTATATSATILLDFGGTGGADVEIKNTDLSLMTAGYIVSNLVVQDDLINVKISRCKIPAAVIISGTLAGKYQKVDATSIDIGDGFHYFEYHRYEGKALESTATYRDGGSTFSPTATDNFSCEMIANANVVVYTQSLDVPLAAAIVLDMTATQNLQIHIMQIDTGTGTPVALNDDEFWIEVTYPDATANALGVTVSSKAADIIATPAALTSSVETWTTSLVGNQTKQYATVALPAITGLTFAPCEISVHLAKAPGATERLFICAKRVLA